MVVRTEKVVSEIPSTIDSAEALDILTGKTDLLDTLSKAHKVRKQWFGNKVRIQILDNIKNGHCPEDCGYCAQRKNANSGVENYSMKSAEEIYADALQAKENGAYRFCMVTSGTGPNGKILDKLIPTIEKITNDLGMKVCLSAGILDAIQAKKLKEAGLDRYNHNINTSESYYGEICSTHTYADRIETMENLRGAGVSLCSGVIVGMGESKDDIVQMAFALKEKAVISIPVNFFIPVPGHAISNPTELQPEFCIRVLSMFRLVNPDSEIRIAAGREGHLRGLQSMALYAANSLFAAGYLNVKGSEFHETVRMILDAGMEPELPNGDAISELDWENGHLYSEENFPEMYKFKKESNNK